MHNWERKQSPFKGISKERQASATGYHHTNFCSKCKAWYGQLGLEPTLDLYISHLLQVTAELKRVLRKDGIMFWNQGDSYASQPTGTLSGYFGDRPSKIACMKAQEDKKKNRPELPVQQKCMILQNFRLILKMIDEQGWILRNSIIWNKPNHMPSSVKDRFANAYEPVFMFTKNSKPVYYYNIKTGLMADRKAKDPKENIDWEWRPCPRCQKDFLAVAPDGKSTYRKSPVLGPCSRCKGTGKIKYSFWRALDYWFDLDAVREPHTETTYKRQLYALEHNEKIKKKHKRSGYPGQDYSRPGRDKIGPKLVKHDVAIGRDGNFSYEDPLHTKPYFETGKNPGDVWIIPTQPFPEAHFATFPEDLVKPMILAGCPRWVCKKCGKARVRITKPDKEYAKHLGTWTEDTDKSKKLRDKIGFQAHTKKKALTADYQTIGWTDCGCPKHTGKANWRPGIVLDPFVGAGAVLRVAKNLGYAGIGIDIKKEYCDMSIKGIKNITPNLPFEG